MRGLDAGHPRHQPMVIWDCAPRHQGGDDGHIQQLRQVHQQLTGICAYDPAPSDDQRVLGGGEHVQRLLRLLARG